MYRRILVPLDGSTFAEAAIGPAVALAEKTGGGVRLLTVKTADDAGQQPEDRTSRHDEMRRYLENTAMRLRSVTSVPLTTAIREGRAADEVVAEAAASEDLVVMTSHGRGGLSRLWLGSVADACIRTSARPVLVVHPPASRPSDFRLDVSRVVVPLDGSQLAECALPAAAELAGLFDAPITLVQSVTTPIALGSAYFPAPDWIPIDPQQSVDDARRYLEAVAARFAGLRERPTVQVSVGEHPARAIHDAAGGAGIVVMATHGFGGVRRALLGSVADKVVRGAEAAVLVVRPNVPTSTRAEASDPAHAAAWGAISIRHRGRKTIQA